MSEAKEFRQYAEEAMRGAHDSNTEQEKRTLIELARTWTQAAAQSERAVVVVNNPPEAKAPLIIEAE